jgi:hypothetical protein
MLEDLVHRALIQILRGAPDKTFRITFDQLEHTVGMVETLVDAEHRTVTFKLHEIQTSGFPLAETEGIQ